MNVRWISRIPVIELSGNLLGDPEVAAFRDRILSFKEQGSTSVVVDLGRLNTINSWGVGALIAAAKTLREAGGDVKLANLSDRTHNVLVVVTRLDKMFRMYETAEGAAASY